MYEYSISNSESDLTISLYHFDKFSKKDILKMIQEVIGNTNDEKGDELLYSIMYMLCDKFEFVNKEWIEYEFSTFLDFEDTRELKRQIKEEIYNF